MTLEPDLPLVRRYLATQQIPGTMVLCAITGAHQYGFPSADSDLDIKAIHLAPLASVLGLAEAPETVDHIEIFEGVECDLTTHEAKKALGLLIKGNGNLLERLCSPYQVLDGPEVASLRALVPHALSRRVHHHYAGYCRGMQAEHLRDGFRVKSLLYSFRVALTGIHLLQSGEVVADLNTLATPLGFPELHALIARKQQGAEKEPLTAEESERFQARWPELLERLTEARDRSQLPEEPAGVDVIDGWLVEARKKLG